MRDFMKDHSSLGLNTATLGHNVDGAGAGWSPERRVCSKGIRRHILVAEGGGRKGI